MGQNDYEELSIVGRGDNMGWNIMEGFHCFKPAKNCAQNNLKLPFHEYDHGLGQSILGGYVYTGEALAPYRQKYIFADSISGRIFAVDHNTPGARAEVLIQTPGLFSSFGRLRDNELVITELQSGKIFPARAHGAGRSTMRPVALSIAGSDSSGGAGIQADLKAFAACGVYGTTAITAITAQNTVGVDAIEILSPEIVYAQIKSVANDMPVAALKTGMLANSEIIRSVARAIADFELTNLVIDTVMVSKSGHRLLAPEAEAAMREVLLPLATLITPNLPQAEVLTGLRITDNATMRRAAQQLHQMGAKNVILKGGHLETPDATDVFFDGETFVELTAPRVTTTSTHGTGCTLSAAIAAHLAKGEKVIDACRAAKVYLTGALQNAEPMGHGHGPVNHFWKIRN